MPIHLQAAAFIVSTLSPKIALQHAQERLNPEALAIWEKEDADYRRSILAQVEDELGDNPDPAAFLMTLGSVLINETERVKREANQ